MLDYLLHPVTQALLLHLTIVVAITIRVIMMRPATGVALAWLLLVADIPFVGVALYLLFGERRISQARARRIEALRTDYEKLAVAVACEGFTNVDWARHAPEAQAMDRLARETIGMPCLHGSTLTLHRDTEEVLDAIARDVDSASVSVLMEFYIWNEGGKSDDVLEALIRAAERGVHCRVLVDAVGGRPWFRGSQPGRLRKAGVEVRKALPTGPLRTIVGRGDLRLHRKIVVIDGRVAWTGSMNLVDPKFFKQDSGVGEWVDAMVRVEGTTVSLLAATMIGDWQLETGEPLLELLDSSGLSISQPQGEADVQVVPSGPRETKDGLLQMLIALVQAAQKEIVLTTPYFVPDESLLRALRGASARGVAVTLILPEKVDSILTRHASRSYYDDLLECGVSIELFRDGLLHTKSITVDRALSMFGTVNLDMRSLWLNYEVSLFVYDRPFAEALHALQEQYRKESDRLDPLEWSRRPFARRFLENATRLVSPLL